MPDASNCFIEIILYIPLTCVLVGVGVAAMFHLSCPLCFRRQRCRGQSPSGRTAVGLAWSPGLPGLLQPAMGTIGER